MAAYQLRPVERGDLALILEWRNRDEVRRYMYTTDVITPEEHRTFFENVWTDPTREYFLCIDAQRLPVGVVNFYNIDRSNSTAFWGFYMSTAARRGLGTVMGYLALNRAFRDMDLIKLSGEVLDFNRRSLKYHQRLGFRIEGIFREARVHAGRRADIYRLAMSRSDWLMYQHPYFKELLQSDRRAGSRLGVGASYETHFMITKRHMRALANLSGSGDTSQADLNADDRTPCHRSSAQATLLNAEISRMLDTVFPGEGTVLLTQFQECLAPAHLDVGLTLRLEIARRVGRRVTVNTTIHETGAPQTTLAVGTSEVLVPQKLLEA